MKTSMWVLAAAIGLNVSVASAQNIAAGNATGTSPGGTTPAAVPITFTRNAAAQVADFTARINYPTASLDAVAAGANGGACSVNDASGFVTVLPPPGLSDVQTNVYCNVTFTIAAAVPDGPLPLTPTTTFAGGGCFDNMANNVACTFTNGAITVGGPMNVAPTITYAPAPTNTVTLTGGAGQIVATPAGGTGTGAAATTTVNTCAISGVAGPGTFGSVAGINLSFVGPTTTAQNMPLSCTQGAAVTTGTLTCQENRGGAGNVARTWPLSCPAGAAAVPPTVNYVPAPGSQVAFTGTPGTLINAVIATTGTGGSGSGAAATARVDNCQISPAFSPPVFACQPSGGNVLDFTPGGADPGDITCSCQSPATGQQTATLSCDETRPLGGAVTVRTWNLACPGVAGSCGSLTFNPNPGPVPFVAGAANIAIAHSGGTVGNTTTFNGCAISGANAGNFSITNSPINLSFAGGSAGQGSIALSCNNPTLAAVSATLSCTQLCDVNNTPRTWTLQCPAGGTPPPTAEVVPVPSSSDFGRILLAAMLVLIGMAAVTIRSRN